jgi:hypothetical protein
LRGSANPIGHDQVEVQYTSKIGFFQDDVSPSQMSNAVAISKLSLQNVE